ncbi:hypothetical protein ABKV19_024671 [Rosa sericea]
MMNTVRVELTNSISPDLSWKVSKGYRSAPRRRKQVDKGPKLGAEPANKSTKSSSETTVSESEKLGVAVLGRRFSDKIEHVPIKKRRFMVRSPSPPPRLTSQLPENNQPGVGDLRASGQKSCSKSIAKKHTTRSDSSSVTSFTHSAITVNESLTEPANEKPGYGEDFSGIEILAAAACNNSIHDDIGEELSREGTNASTSARPLAKTVASFSSTPMITDSEISEGRDASLETIHYSPKDVVHEDKIENSFVEDSLVKTNTGDGDDLAVASSKDVRLHWDLNVCMDAWEEPCDTVMVDPQPNAEDNISIDRQSEKQPVSQDGDAQGSVEAKNPKLLPVVVDVEQGLKASPDSEISYGKSGLADNALGSSKDAGVVTNNSNQDVSMDACGDNSSCVRFDNIAGTPTVPLEKNGTPPASIGAQLGDTICSGKIEVENPAITCVPVVEGVSCEMGSTVVDDDGKGSAATSSFHDDPKSPEEMTAVESCHLQKSCPEVRPVGKTEDVIKPASGASVGELSLVTLIAKDQVEAASQTHTVNSIQNAGSLEVMPKSSTSATKDPPADAGPSRHEQCHYGGGTAGSKVTTVDSSGVNCHFDDKDHMVANNNPTEQEVGYDSQYEDGELRESDVPYWEENEFDEVERVDYGSDTCDTDAADGSVSGKVECRETEFCGVESRNINMNVQVVRGLSLGSDNMCGKVEHSATGNALRQSSVGSKTRTSGSEQLPGDSEASSNRTAGATEGCTIRKHTGDCFDGLNGKDPAKLDGSMTSDTLNRMGTSSGRRYDTFDFSTRSEEVGSVYSMGKERSDSRMLGKSLGGVRFASRSHWDSKRRGSPPYRGSFGSGRPRPRSGIESDEYAMDPDDTFSEAAEVAGVHNRVRRQAMSYNSNRSYQPTFRRRSPDTHRGMIPMRDISPDRKRRYPQGVGRGMRDYHRPIPGELNDSSYNGPRRMTRREPSASPPGRGPYYGRPKFQSRGRSRSPLAWERHEVSRHRGSRSPDYRFDGKMERGRVPFQKNSFGAKYEAGFFSPPKRRFSPQHNSRWFDDRNGAGDHNFRGRRGGGRRFQPSQRFDSLRSRRVDSDDYFEPIVRPRFSELNNGGRECRFEGSDEDRRKPEGRFEIVHRVRRYDSDGVVRQFRYDEEDRFASRNTQNFDDCDNRGTDRRPRDVYLGEQQQIENRRVTKQ